MVGVGEADITATASGLSARTHAFAPGRPSVRLTTTIGIYGSTVALYGATAVTFDLRASVGTGLIYRVSYGDSGSSSDALSQHVYPAPGYYGALATVTDVLGRTDTVKQTVRVVSLANVSSAYGWVDTPSQYRHVWFDSQVGQTVSGRYWDSGPQTRDFKGSLRADGSVDLVFANGTIRMTGHILLKNACGFCLLRGDLVILTFSGGSEAGKTIIFEPFDPF